METLSSQQQQQQRQKYSWPVRWLSRPLKWMFPDLTTDQLRNLLSKFNIANLLFCYCIPFFYVFYPTLLMPAIFLRSLSFVVGWAHGLVSRHHPNPQRHGTSTNNNNNNNNNGAGAGVGNSRRQPRRPDTISRTNTNTSITSNTNTNTNTNNDGMNNMYFWLQRCSICLDHTYALCLENCRDQFCKECFARYVEEIVNTSWGLGVTRIRCPVCKETIAQSEWSRYVSSDIVERYDRYNQPYRAFSRHCLDCETVITPCHGPRSERISHERRLELISHDLSLLHQKSGHHNQNRLQEKDKEDREENDKQKQVIELQSMFEKARLSRRTSRVGQVQELYGQMVPLLKKQAGECDKYKLCSAISKQLVALETLPEAWKLLQFVHVANFPIETCTTCQKQVCLQCGEFSHPDLSCLEHLKHRLTIDNESDESLIVKWKLEHTQPCPNCSVMIHRDEGCNKVDCLLCGFRFCWSCGSKWSQQCGFYQCQQQPIKDDIGITPEKKVELGVPDMDAIDAKRPTNSK
ncbi:hypothetical protein PHYBLDRAFT_65243 [Phycomyces blakesleeanus NRRL 1555(-)]|uniref:RING-type domain-containing protein n=1 Tax=Phycomyces blakesleeanus (strain ATCC 8743b / DSM 1359 / FGSC 10004 / NBRC 33097 / NRRL 1555) TaxID=763407 RepID=A0A162U6U5_PHYB8|nr:hypothetical protein PHYBLDRAFT_65243 [Phycomyces blakesleeanus NRRL 1555(-)]OAD72833.1 hypothetical protein PHYBLDRAFT_65243 [Phycomyces blakesleeanus NRRL 1555(-)]|eukprot:XP_018290873.1 hypothetical protein PHYBLDRAFT_65243 [Phycomyces blakesleeanus NRRL 1555(-)]